MDWMWLLSGACIVFTLGMFSSGLSDLRVMVAKRSVENIQFLPFLTTDLNNLGWFYYGYLKGDGTLIIVNLIGASLQTLYMAAYILYSLERAQIIKSKSTKCLSFPLTVATFLTSTSWVLYGWVQSDLYITVPNFPGIVTSLLRFWLFSRYPPDQPAYSLL
ncbi:hypothetical protein XENTR_v10022888 [Xenopus tropicalis]|nr:hypothetical protein XENTR_v10022888 [Xenopus tropicalis]